uniref:Uncharacterized protein n=1 Tax=Parascaris equorum TaxID=6256 RepID=A0A914RXK2_PAREQ
MEKVTSPLTHNISGTAKAAAQTVIAVVWWQENVPNNLTPSDCHDVFFGRGYVGAHNAPSDKLARNHPEQIAS